jgi:hypothetical protein
MPLSDEPNPRTDVLPDPPEPTQTLLTKCYLTFILLEGDANKTALACNVSPAFVERHAKREDWQSRLDATINMCSPSSRGPAEIERLLNRAALYVQAQRIRRIIDSVISEVETAAVADKSVLDLFRVTTESGQRIDLKPLADLSNAAVKLSQMANAAMCDTAAERAARVKHDKSTADDSLAMGSKVLEGLARIPVACPDPEALALDVVGDAMERLSDAKDVSET